MHNFDFLVVIKEVPNLLESNVAETYATSLLSNSAANSLDFIPASSSSTLAMENVFPEEGVPTKRTTTYRLDSSSGESFL